LFILKFIKIIADCKAELTFGDAKNGESLVQLIYSLLNTVFYSTFASAFRGAYLANAAAVPHSTMKLRLYPLNLNRIMPAKEKRANLLCTSQTHLRLFFLM